tara:strand:+ start:27 stop:371 length:345 start_codon:yes stop_codon:yes gene_type:complete
LQQAGKTKNCQPIGNQNYKFFDLIHSFGNVGRERFLLEHLLFHLCQSIRNLDNARGQMRSTRLQNSVYFQTFGEKIIRLTPLRRNYQEFYQQGYQSGADCLARYTSKQLMQDRK